tara:strand:+ start:2177 stop:3019 length:843 start_codon:yes stop_codon:yes gene_type:complete
MTNPCCINHNQKTIFSSNDYMWKICENCDLIYQLSKSDRTNKVKEVLFDNFEEPDENGRAEFLSNLNKLKKYSELSNLTFVDFGCGDGSYLKLAEEYFKKVQGMEPNKFLKEKAIKKNLDILSDNFLDDNKDYYDVIFTRNTFEYVNGFSITLKKLMHRLNYNGYFMWRDKFYDHYPKNYSSRDFSDGFNSLPTKNAIRHHLSTNQIKILESRFYFDKSFLIIGQKKKEFKNIFKKKINLNKIFYNNYFVCNLIFHFTKVIHFIYIIIRKFKNSILEKTK